MKVIAQLGKDLENFTKKLEKNLIQAQKETAQKIQNDAKNYSPVPGGEYANSIKTSDTEVNGDIIKTYIYTDMKSSDNHFIGRMIENGTGIYALEPHIGKTKTFFNSNYRYWYVPTSKVKKAIGQKITINGVDYYVAKAQKPKPHFRPALDNNITTYRENIKQAIRRAK